MHEDEFPEKSVAVRETLLVPTLAQVKLDTSIPNVGVPQLSEEPPSISVAAIEAFPEPSK